MSFSFVYPTPLPSTKGWGPGWPNCQYDAITPHPIFQGGVHRKIHRLVNELVAELERRGYEFTGNDSWGFGCRGTKSSSGSTSGTPSFHSWGLGLDFNAQQNVFGSPASTSDLATTNRWVVKFMRNYGFFWLGPSIGDWMHFSFCGSPRDARRMTRKAIADFAPEYVAGGRTFKRLRRALRYTRLLLEDGRDLVKVRRR